MNKQEHTQQDFVEFLTMYLGHVSEDHGNYYPHLQDGVVTIVDRDGMKCDVPSIYQLVEVQAPDYGYRMTKKLTFVEI